MIANWLPNNVPKLSTILCSAGMIVPWLIPNSAVGHSSVPVRGYSNWKSDKDKTVEEAFHNAEFNCDAYNGSLSINSWWTSTRTNKTTGVKRYKTWAKGTCDLPPHKHPQATNAGLGS